ncbi:hypothetical protein AC1031_007140 [Aphanomyces cochlioides]|nr:hypothetical protein AC1031_007140 [Aphanomyces cochlioides]
MSCRPQSAASVKLHIRSIARPQTAASACKRVKIDSSTTSKPGPEYVPQIPPSMTVSVMERVADVDLTSKPNQESEPSPKTRNTFCMRQLLRQSPPKQFGAMRQIHMKSEEEYHTVSNQAINRAYNDDNMKPISDSIEKWVRRKQEEALKNKTHNQFVHVETFHYSVPTHHFDQSLPYDPYTITTVSFRTVYAVDEGEFHGLKFSDDDRLIDQQILCDFYVMSSKNVLYYNKKQGSVTFQSLAEWERERRIFQSLKLLTLFKTYRVSKALKCWISHHFLCKRETCKKLLMEQLYFCNPIFNDTMREIQAKLVHLDTLVLFQMETGTTMSPDEFQKRQAQRVSMLGKELVLCCDEVRDILVKLSDTYLSQYSSADAVIKYADVSLTSRKSTTYHMDQFFGTLNKKIIPQSPLATYNEDDAAQLDLVAIRAELQRSRVRNRTRECKREKPTLETIKWSLAAVKRARCNELSWFIRRVDFMLLDCFHGAINRSATDLVHLLEMGAGKSSSVLLSKDSYIRAYHRFDVYGNGALDCTQIARLLHYVYDGKLTGQALDDRVALFISVFDENGDGDVSLEEFSNGLDEVLDVERMQQFDAAANSIYESKRLAHVNLLAPVPLFEVNLIFGEKGLHFEPTLKSIQDAIEMTLRGFFDANEQIERLILHSTIMPILNFADQYRTFQIDKQTPGKCLGDIPHESRVSLLLFERASQDQSYSSTCERIFEIIKGSICGCQAYANCFEPLCLEHDLNNSLNFNDLAHMHMEGNYDLNAIKENIQKFKKQQTMLDDLAISQDIQLVRVKTVDLKAALLPSPVRCLSELERILPILAEKHIATLLNYIESVATRIQRPASRDLESFVQYILNLKEVNDELPSKDHQAAQITDYFALILESGFQIPDHTQAVYDIVEPELSTLKALVTTCMARRDMDIRENAHFLGQNIEHLEANIAYLQTESCAEQLFQSETQALNALEFTGNLKRLAAEYGKLSERYLFIRSLFNDFLPNVMPDLPNSQSHFDTLPKLSTDVNLKHKLWNTILEAEQSFSTWGDMSLKTLPLSEMHDLLSRLKDLHQVLSDIYPTSPVTARIEGLTLLLTKMTTIIENLCNEHVEERHWQKLENKLQVKFQYDMEQAASSDHRSLCRQTEISFKYLLSLNIQDKLNDIDEIVQEAVAEAAISKNLQETIKLWETKEISFSYWTDNESRDITVLGDTTECMNMLEESDVRTTFLGFVNCFVVTPSNYNVLIVHKTNSATGNEMEA